MGDGLGDPVTPQYCSPSAIQTQKKKAMLVSNMILIINMRSCIRLPGFTSQLVTDPLRDVEEGHLSMSLFPQLQTGSNTRRVTRIK